MNANNRASKRITWRKAAVYVSSIALIALADPRPATFWVGVMLVCIAWALRIWAFGYLDKNALMVTTGPYAYTRNPAYLGSFIALIGISLASGNFETARGKLIWGFALVLVVCFFSFYFPRKMQREYPRLKALFGQQLDEHAANVPNFWPRLSPWKSGQERSWSFAMLRENHELSWGVAFVVALAAIYYVTIWSPFALA
ncbi:MAG: isoprenylcysteine carboxylmethyltransferase family protein [Planctomycetota bacterium]|jgi:protein-S-isoprenylcysteine O-methyltransferase Ste14|nr:isoprenylcysteine carboxylmethyltransferase family protein [Planctomycetota bacterium]